MKIYQDFDKSKARKCCFCEHVAVSDIVFAARFIFLNNFIFVIFKVFHLANAKISAKMLAKISIILLVLHLNICACNIEFSRISFCLFLIFPQYLVRNVLYNTL